MHTELQPSSLPSLVPYPLVTVVITTKNRSSDLLKTLASVREQAERCEVLVLDDGSTDGTAERVRAEFPEVTLVRSERSLGYIVQRNRAAAMATTPFLVSLDDDAIFSSPDVLGQTLRDFDTPRVGAVAIPLVDVREGPTVKQRAPEEAGVYLCERFKGTAYAVRRELFLKLGGFRETFVHQGEEGDFCLRLLAAGWFVRLGRADPIHHFESPRRDFSRVDYYGRRNDVLHCWYNVPVTHLPAHLAGVTWLGMKFGVKTGRAGAMARGLAAGYRCIWSAAVKRQPVSRAAYRLSRRLKRERAVPFEEVAGIVAPSKG